MSEFFNFLLNYPLIECEIVSSELDQILYCYESNKAAFYL